MEFQPVPLTASVELVYFNGENYSENVLHYTFALRPGEDQLFDLASMVKAWWNDGMKNSFPATMFLSKIIVRSLHSETDPAIEFTDGLPLAGGVVNPVLPANVTLAIKMITGLRGRSYRGRVYHVGLMEQNVTGDRIDGAFANLIKSYWEDLLALKLYEDDLGWVVVSRWHNKVKRVNGVSTAITSIGVDPVVDSQRRRLINH